MQYNECPYPKVQQIVRSGCRGCGIGSGIGSGGPVGLRLRQNFPGGIRQLSGYFYLKRQARQTVGPLNDHGNSRLLQQSLYRRNLHFGIHALKNGNGLQVEFRGRVRIPFSALEDTLRVLSLIGTHRNNHFGVNACGQ